MEDFEGNERYAEYKNFIVDDEKVMLTDLVETAHEGVHERAARGSELQLRWPIPDYSADMRHAYSSSHNTRAVFRLGLFCSSIVRASRTSGCKPAKIATMV